MKTIGITGGIGAGKTAVLNYIAEHFNARVIVADKVAYELESPGGVCYDNIVDLLGADILDESGFIDKKAMAAAIFVDPGLLENVNRIIHPEVKKYILEEIDKEYAALRYDLVVIEAALLIEDGYYRLLDELWYVRADEEIRRERLRISRGYSDEKIDSIMKSQNDDAFYMEYCRSVIDNSGNLDETFAQTDALVRHLLEG